MAQFQRISAAAALERLAQHPEAQLLDIRARADFNQGHIPGAAYFTQDQLPLMAKRLSKDTPILIYCYHGNASQTFAQFFIDFRFTQVFSIDGGYEHLSKLLTPQVSA
ncbi:MAG: thiosulfate sulfurtransferase GlpE [Marinagarivorans sp.]